MNYTTNFNLNKPEGTDLYNHLTVDNPNMDTIDAAMQANKLASVGAATELVSGTVHAITRSDSNQNIFKFKATGNFHLGDTITVDGVSVNAYTTAGQPLNEKAYVLSAIVLCFLDGSSLWVLTNKIPDAIGLQFDTLLTQLDIQSTAISYNCNWDNYDVLSFEAIYNNNVRSQITVPKSYFEITNVSRNVQCTDPVANSTYQIFQNTSNSIYVSCSNPQSARGIRVYGIKLS